MMGVMLGLLVVSTRFKYLPQDDPAWIFLQVWGAVCVVVAVIGLLLEWAEVRSVRPVFKVTGDVQWGSTWSRLSSGDRIALVSAGIAGLTLLATAALTDPYVVLREVVSPSHGSPTQGRRVWL